MVQRWPWASVVASALALGCSSSDPNAETSARPADSSPGSARASAPAPVDPDERRQELDFEEAEALDKAGPSCGEKAKALRAYRDRTRRERAEVEESLQRKRAAGQAEPPMTEKQTTRFQFVKKTLVDILGRCLGDDAFSAAFSNEPEPPPPGEWIPYRDP